MHVSDNVKAVIANALAEDIGEGDATSNAVIPKDSIANYAIMAREDMVLSGLNIAEYLADLYRLVIACNFEDGNHVKQGDKIAEISGNAREILKIERVMLNFMQHLSGIAKITDKYVNELASDEVKLLDTRKTTPNLRELEKYAVKCGGGQNHRMGLYDMVMIKDNHIKAAGGVKAAIEKAKESGLKIEIECDTLEQVNEALEVEPDIIMLDNFELPDLETAVELIAGRAEIEASGGVNLETIRRISKTGVNYISTSKITQGAMAVDIGLDEI